MTNSAKRLTRQLLIVTPALLSTTYLYAQAAGGLNIGPVEILFVFIVIAVFLWQAIRRRNRRRTDLPNVQESEPTQSQPPANQLTPVPVPPSPAGLIFISYRRQDSQHITGRIYDKLSTQFGKSSVFKDVDAIPLGVDFREHLQEKVGQCSVLVAVIGKDWNQTSISSIQRLTDPQDYLRIEIETALERRIPVIPVLVDGVAMPDEKDLPPSLARLAYYNGISVRPDPDFHHDAARLLRGIESLLKG
jgi:hypothetical protein